MLAEDSHGNVVYLVCSDEAKAYVKTEVVDRGMPIGQGLIVGPDALQQAQAKVKVCAGWGRKMKIYALIEVE